MPRHNTDPQQKQGPSNTGLVFVENQIACNHTKSLVSSFLPAELITGDPAQAEFKLALTEEHLQLQLNQSDAPGAIYADFISGKARYRLGQGELISRAVGLSKLKNPSVLDATAGLGRDAFVLASKGCNVTLIEQSPVIYLLLQDALERAKNNTGTRPIIERMKLINMDAKNYLNSEDTPQADIIYLDPMYPERKKSALVKKEMQIFQKLLGKQATDEALLPTAIKRAKYRVVIKRPLKSEYLNNLKPAYSITGKSIRFDIHITTC